MTIWPGTRAIERKPVTGRYRGHVLFTGGPPVSTGVSLLEAFQVLGNYTPKANATPATDAEYWHYLIESWKVRDRVARIADPAQWPVDFEEHLESMHAANLFNRIDSQRAQSFPEDSDEIGGGPERIGSGTSGFVVADVEGNVIAITQTLSTWGGSFYVSRGLGFLYNNHLRSNRTAPGSYGQLRPLSRSNTANVPMLVFKEKAGTLVPRLAVASAGNAWIPASTYSIVTGVLDGGLSMQQAIEAPVSWSAAIRWTLAGEVPVWRSRTGSRARSCRRSRHAVIDSRRSAERVSCATGLHLVRSSTRSTAR